MSVIFSDDEIKSLVAEPKSIPANWRALQELRQKRGHRERSLTATGVSGGQFRLILRKNIVMPLDFSLILATYIPYSNKIFRLRRYNGKSHKHTNAIEKNSFYNFHIHFATARYQELEFGREDGYAEQTDRYADYRSAISCFVEDLNLILYNEEQRELFPED